MDETKFIETLEDIIDVPSKDRPTKIEKLLKDNKKIVGEVSVDGLLGDNKSWDLLAKSRIYVTENYGDDINAEINDLMDEFEIFKNKLKASRGRSPVKRVSPSPVKRVSPSPVKRVKKVKISLKDRGINVKKVGKLIVFYGPGIDEIPEIKNKQSDVRNELKAMGGVVKPKALIDGKPYYAFAFDISNEGRIREFFENMD